LKQLASIPKLARLANYPCLNGFACILKTNNLSDLLKPRLI
jgi:hypothetical protein